MTDNLLTRLASVKNTCQGKRAHVKKAVKEN